MLAIGCVFFVVAALVEGLLTGTVRDLVSAPFTNTDLLTAVLYEGLGCSIAAFFMNNVAIVNIGVNRTSSFVGLSTVVTIVSGVLILHEPFTVIQIIGAVVVVLGVYIANAASRKN